MAHRSWHRLIASGGLAMVLAATPLLATPGVTPTAVAAVPAASGPTAAAPVASTPAAGPTTAEQWVEQWGAACGSSGACSDYTTAVAIGPDGTRLVAGYFGKPSARFGRGPREEVLAGPAGQTAFVAAYEPDSRLRWARQVALAGQLADPYVIAVDGSDDGSVVVVGRYSVDVDFGNGVTLPGGPYEDNAFVVAFTASGIAQWAQAIHAEIGSYVGGVAVTPGGDVIVSGTGVGTTAFGDDSDLITLPVEGDDTQAYIASYSPAGEPKWALAVNGPLSDGGSDVTVAPDGTIVTRGTFRGTATFGPGPGAPTRTSRGDSDSYVLTLETDGTVRDVHVVSTDGSIETLNGVSVGADGTIAVLGRLFSSRFVYVDDIAVPTYWDDVAVYGVTFAPDGSLGGVDFLRSNSGSRVLYAGGIEVAPDGTRFVTATYKFDLQVGTGDSAVRVGDTNRYTDWNTAVAAFAPDGTVAWVTSMLGAYSTAPLVSDPDGKLFTGGRFEPAGLFPEGSGTQQLHSWGDFDGYVAQLVPTADRLLLEASVEPRTIPHTGGVLTVTTTITNVGGEPAPYDVSVEYIGDLGAVVTNRLGSGTIAGSSTVTRRFELRVAASHRDATYELRVNVGDLDTLRVSAQDSFEIVKGAG